MFCFIAFPAIMFISTNSSSNTEANGTNITELNQTSSFGEKEELKEEEEESDLMKIKKNLLLLIEDEDNSAKGISISAIVNGK